MKLTAPLSIVLVIALAACDRSGDAESGAAADSAATAPTPGDSLSVTGFATPESVLYDEAADVYLVSNINGQPLDKDDNGFISVVAPDGTVQSLKWVDGAAANITLHAPKGMAIIGDTLFVADIDTVRGFSRSTGAAVAARGVPGATFLNDLAASSDGVLYVVDSGLKPDFSSSGTDAVYRFDGGNAVALVRGTDKLHGPNGLAVTPDGVVMVPFGANTVHRITSDGTITQIAQLPTGGLDGVVFTSTGLLISSWDGKAVYKLDAQGQQTTIMANIESPADIGYDSKRGRLLVPVFNQHRLEIRKR